MPISIPQIPLSALLAAWAHIVEQRIAGDDRGVDRGIELRRPAPAGAGVPEGDKAATADSSLGFFFYFRALLELAGAACLFKQFPAAGSVGHPGNYIGLTADLPVVGADFISQAK